MAVVAVHLFEPGNDVGIGAGLEGADLACGGLGVGRARLQRLHTQGCLDIAQRHGQQRRRLVGRRAFGKALHHTKRRRRKLGQRRHAARGHLQRKVVGVAQRAARGVLEILGQLQREGRVFGQGRGKLHAVHQGIGLRAFGATVQARLQGFGGRFQADGGCQLARHGRVEGQLQRPNRQAGGLGVLALATELGGKRLAHLVVKALFHRVGHATGRGHAFAKHQLQARARGEAPVAGQGHHLQRILERALLQPQRFQHFAALVALDQPHRHALAHPFHGAPHVGLHAGQRGRSVQLQHKKLFFVDLFVGAGPHAPDKRATTIKLIANCARQ